MPRTTIGFVADSFTDYYQLCLLEGAIQAAADRSAHLIAFAAGIPQTNRPEIGWLSRASFDTLVAVSATMAYGIGLGGLGEYFGSLANLPVSFIGAQVPGAPAVLIDNRAGMEQAVSHLLRIHEKRKVAFIAGPAGHDESDARLDGYRAALAAGGIPVDPALVAHGDFMRHSGQRLMREMLGRGLVPDAVAAANDIMAFGALEALGERGLVVPRDVALVGFDDSEEGHFSVPSLTSVRQPLDQLGREAVRLALARAAGDSVASVVVPLGLMVRTSCGCRGEASGLISSQPLRETSFEAAFAERRSLIHAEMSRAAQAALGRLSSGWVDRLLQAFVDEIRGLGGERFRQVLTDEVTRSRQSRGQLRIWQRVLSVLRQQARPCFGNDLTRLGKAEDLWHMGRELLAEAMQSDEAIRRMRMEHWVRMLRDSSIALSRCRHLDDLLAALVEHFGRLGFRRAYLALTEANTIYSRLVLGYDRDLSLESHEQAPIFPTEELAPRDLMASPEACVWVLLPLVVDRHTYGHLLVDGGPGEGCVWEGLRQQVTAALACIELGGGMRG